MGITDILTKVECEISLTLKECEISFHSFSSLISSSEFLSFPSVGLVRVLVGFSLFLPFSLRFSGGVNVHGIVCFGDFSGGASGREPACQCRRC